jgi:hypothetical protein
MDTARRGARRGICKGPQKFPDGGVFVIEHEALSPLGTVVLQTRTLGAELDYDSVALGWSNASGLQRWRRSRGSS